MQSTLLPVTILLCLLSACGGYEPSEENVRSSGTGLTSTTTSVSQELPKKLEVTGTSVKPSSSPDPVAATLQQVKLAGPRNTASAEQLENLCLGFDTTAERRVVPRVDKPPYMTPYRDPAFGARVIRISDGRAGEVNKPAYSTMQAWNADESLLLLYRTGVDDGGHYLHDGRSYQQIRKLDIYPSDLEDVFWSYSDPETYFFISRDKGKRNHLIRANAMSGEEQLLIDLSSVCGAGGRAIAGYDVQMHSHDDEVFGFRCKYDNKNQSIAGTYTVSTGKIQTLNTSKGRGYDEAIAPMVAPSGLRSLLPPIQLSTDLGKTEFTLDLAKSEHSSTGKAWNGEDAFFSTTFAASPRSCDDEVWQGVSSLVEFNLQRNTCRTVMKQSEGWPATISGTHVSATAYKRPGWVAMSSIGYKNLHYLHMDRMQNKSAPAFFSSIYLVNTDPQRFAVCRLAQHRSTGKSARNGGYAPYFGEPHATLSPSGTRIMFGSDWYDSGTVDAYVIELPAYNPATKP